MTVFYIVVAILLFGLLILVHEFGHFVTAKLSGVRVNEFALFMGPAIWKKQKGETLYALRCIPIGGYCAMEGEDGDSDDPRAFGRAKLWKKLIILVAGSFMNFVAGFVILLLLFAFSFSYIPSRQVAQIAPERPFAQHIQVGDSFYEIDGRRVYIQQDITLLLDRDTDGLHDITVIRNGEKVYLEDVPMNQDYVGEDGVARYGFTIGSEEKTFGSVLSYSWNSAVDFVRMVPMSLGDLFSGRASVKDVSGVVGIVDVVVEQGVQAESVGIGMTNVFYLFAFVAVNLAVMNLLPIPALDGGRVVTLLLTTLIEKIIGRKIDPKYEAYINGAFMILLLALIAVITFKDVFQLFQ